MSNTLEQYAYQVVDLPVVDVAEDGTQTPIDANTFVEAEYRIVNTATGELVYSASLGGDISVKGTDLCLTIPENALTVTGVNGEYSHFLRMATAANQLGRTVFNSTVPILPGGYVA